ncbi:hypothetical protein [Haloferula sp. A504]|uniref:hypothetical protein n=1 Tax=Haloferula sp. A504 TaxID=3373601 RepID=UPI0031CB5B74|nr:hypothetical protein [Verrucomicrobiaceae bacterium E54]
MSRYKPFSVSLLPERIEMIEARARELGLSKSKYLQALVDADIDVGLLDCTVDAKGGKPVVTLKDGVSVVVLDKAAVESLSVDLIENAVRTLGRIYPDLRMSSLANPIRKTATQVVKEKR